MSWGQGYVTDIDYVHHFNRELSPQWLRTACSLCNVATSDGPLTYLELGSGQGYGLNLLAASDPASTFFGVDFNPAHIVGARRWAARAELHNVTFAERSFEHLAANLHELPDSDIIVLHGIYTWVGPTQREALRRIISAKLKTGGLLYIAYNCMVGWGPIAALQPMLRQFQQARGRTSEESQLTVKELHDLHGRGFCFLSENQYITKKLSELASSDSRYLAHEYLNEFWNPMFAQDMIRDMELCKLSFAGSARPADNILEFALKPELADVVAREKDLGLRECLKDMALNTTLRQDIFVRGLMRRSIPDWRDRLGSSKFVLTKPRSEVDLTVGVPRGTVQLRRPIYSAALDRMALGPASLGDLVVGEEPLVEPIVLMLQSGWAAPAAEEPLDPAPAWRLNKLLADLTRGPTIFPFFACPAIASGLRLDPVESRALASVIRDPDRSLADVVQALAFRSESEPGNRSAGPERDPKSLTADTLNAKIDAWRRLGLLPP